MYMIAFELLNGIEASSSSITKKSVTLSRKSSVSKLSGRMFSTGLISPVSSTCCANRLSTCSMSAISPESNPEMVFCSTSS